MIEGCDHIQRRTGYNRFLLLVAGLGGLLYGIDVGIIAGALPYLEATSGLTSSQLSFVVAAVLLGTVILNSVCRCDCRLDRAEEADDGQRPAVCHQYSLDRAGPCVRYVDYGPVIAGNQWRFYRCGRSVVSCRMSRGKQSWQRHSCISMVVDLWDCCRCFGRNVLQLSS